MRVVLLFILVILSFGLAGCSTTSGGNSEMPKLNLTLNQKLIKANEAYEEAQLDRAEALFQDITSTNPGLIDAWIKLGNIYVRQSRLKAAIRCFEEAIKLDKNDGRPWYNLALARVKQAAQTLETAQQIVPEESKYQLYFASLHQSLIKRVKEN